MSTDLVQQSQNFARLAREFTTNADRRVREVRGLHHLSAQPLLDAAYYAAMSAHSYARDVGIQAAAVASYPPVVAVNEAEAAKGGDHAQMFAQAATEQRAMMDVYADLCQRAYIEACRAVEVADHLLAMFAETQKPPLLEPEALYQVAFAFEWAPDDDIAGITDRLMVYGEIAGVKTVTAPGGGSFHYNVICEVGAEVQTLDAHRTCEEIIAKARQDAAAAAERIAE